MMLNEAKEILSTCKRMELVDAAGFTCPLMREIGDVTKRHHSET